MDPSPKSDADIAAAMMDLPEFVKSREQAKNARAEGRTSSAAEFLADFAARHEEAAGSAGAARSIDEVMRVVGPSLAADLAQADADLAAGRTRPMSEMLAELYSPEELAAAEIVGFADTEMLTALAMLADESDDLINHIFSTMLFGSRMWLQAYGLAVEDEDALLTVTELGRKVCTLAHEYIVLRGAERLAARSEPSAAAQALAQVPEFVASRERAAKAIAAGEGRPASELLAELEAEDAEGHIQAFAEGEAYGDDPLRSRQTP